MVTLAVVWNAGRKWLWRNIMDKISKEVKECIDLLLAYFEAEELANQGQYARACWATEKLTKILRPVANENDQVNLRLLAKVLRQIFVNCAVQ